MNTGSASSTATSCSRPRPTSRLPSTRRRARASPPTTSSPKASTSSGTRGSPRSSSTSSSSRSSFRPDAEELEQAKAIVPEFFESGIAISAGVSAGNQIYLDYVTPLLEGQPEAGASDLLGTAPGDALGAAAIETIGAFGPPDRRSAHASQRGGRRPRRLPRGGARSVLRGASTGVSIDEAAAALGDASLWVRGELPDALEVAGEIEVSDTEAATALIEALEEEVSEEDGAKIGPPVGGSDVGFSALEDTSTLTTACEPSRHDEPTARPATLTPSRRRTALPARPTAARFPRSQPRRPALRRTSSSTAT